MNIDFDYMLQNTTFDDSCLSDTNDEMSLTNGIITPGEYDDYNFQIPFCSHINEIYDSSIEFAQDNIIPHLQETTEAKTLDDLNSHISNVEKNHKIETFWQDIIHDVELDSFERGTSSEEVTSSLEIVNKNQRELGDTFNSHHSDLSFNGNLGNMYDKNAMTFIDECHRHNIDLPFSVDRSHISSESVVDRSVDGGFTYIDKSIIGNTLKDYHDKGTLSDCDYDKLSSMLNKC